MVGVELNTDWLSTKPLSCYIMHPNLSTIPHHIHTNNDLSFYISAEGAIETLRMENRTLRMKLDSTTTRMTECDESLAQASEQLASLSREVAGIAETRDDLSTAEAEVGVLKGDIARLLRLLEHYPAAKGFLAKWRDGDGLAFMGIPNKEKEAALKSAKALHDGPYAVDNQVSGAHTHNTYTHIHYLQE